MQLRVVMDQIIRQIFFVLVRQEVVGVQDLPFLVVMGVTVDFLLVVEEGEVHQIQELLLVQGEQEQQDLR